MNNKIIRILIFVLIVFFPFFGFAAKYSVQDLVREYIDVEYYRRTPLDFRNQHSAREIIDLHNVWTYDRNFLIYRPIQIPEKNGLMGSLYQSGVYYDIYQTHFNHTYNLLTEIHDELEDALDLSCKICIQKQRIQLQTCPSTCYTRM